MFCPEMPLAPFFKALPRFFAFSKSFINSLSILRHFKQMAARPGTSIRKRIPFLGAFRKSAERQIQKKTKKSTPSAGAFDAKGVDCYGW